jgi:hypothetical protein
MSIIELGALGEFIGAIAVVVTLAYLAIQIRQNTHAMEENKRLALAQTYQMRADALQQMLVQASESEFIGPIITKLTLAGYPEDVASLAILTPEERGRFRQWQIAQQTHWDNMYFQYEQGFLDEEYYRDSFRERVRRLAPIWKALDVGGSRKSFAEEIDRIMKEAAASERASDGSGPPHTDSAPPESEVPVEKN